jgi:hypothetical protein
VRRAPKARVFVSRSEKKIKSPRRAHQRLASISIEPVTHAHTLSLTHTCATHLSVPANNKRTLVVHCSTAAVAAVPSEVAVATAAAAAAVARCSTWWQATTTKTTVIACLVPDIGSRHRGRPLKVPSLAVVEEVESTPRTLTPKAKRKTRARRMMGLGP